MRYGSNRGNVDVGLSARIERDASTDRLRLRLSAVYTYMREMVRRPLLEYAVEAEFEIPELDEYVAFSGDRSMIDIPPGVMTMMLGVAVGALRGMIAQRTAGTALEDRPLPLVNLSRLVSRLIYGTRPSSKIVPLTSQAIG